MKTEGVRERMPPKEFASTFLLPFDSGMKRFFFLDPLFSHAAFLSDISVSRLVFVRNGFWGVLK